MFALELQFLAASGILGGVFAVVLGEELIYHLAFFLDRRYTP